MRGLWKTSSDSPPTLRVAPSPARGVKEAKGCADSASGAVSMALHRHVGRFAVLAAAGCAAGCGPSSPDLSGTDLELWSLIGQARTYDRARRAPDGTKTADRLDLEAGDGLWARTARPVRAGDVVEFGLVMWGRGEPELALQVTGYCTVGPAEVATRRIKLTRTPQAYSVSHRFAHDHGCARVQLVLASADANVFAWRPRTRIVPGARPAPPPQGDPPPTP